MLAGSLPPVARSRRSAAASTVARGYGREHVLERRRWVTLVASGTVTCSRCGRLLEPGAAFDLDHADDRSGYIGAAHPRCNRAAGGRKAGVNRRRRAARNETRLRW